MEIITGTIILRGNKVLMVREAKKECYKQWSFPAGHIEKNETVFEGAERELLEETGCTAILKKAFPVLVHNTNDDRSILMVYFLADLEKSGLKYDTDEILETKWIDINEIRNMREEEFRSYPVIKNIIESLEERKLYELDVYKNLKII